jgi:hypothetical protein
MKYSEFIPLDPDKINLDELYDTQVDKRKYISDTYNMILKRVHTRIKQTSKSREFNNLCWYTVPNFVFGRHNYDIGECIVFLINSLTEDGCNVRYIGPNLLCISWVNYVPKYARPGLKKQGINVSEQGEIIPVHSVDYPLRLEPPRPAREPDMRPLDINQEHQPQTTNNRSDLSSQKIKHRSTSEYKPTGKLLYTPDMISNLSGVFK